MIRKRRWQESPVTGESTKETVKTIRAGNAGPIRRTCGDYARVLFYFARETAGAVDAPGIPCALDFEGGCHQLGRACVAGGRTRVASLFAAHPSRRGLPAAPQDEVVIRGAKSDPHGEEARPAVSNHEAVEGMAVA